jgi:type IV pilus assembly protein PilA
MFQWILKKARKDNKGFTLIELVVVIAILGVLTVIAVPKLTISKKTATITAHNANVKTLENAASMYMVEYDLPTENGKVEWNSKGGTRASTIIDTSKDNNKWTLYLQEWPKIPKGIDELKDSEGNEFKGENYVVTIDSKGNITVEPIAISEE